MNSSGQMHHHRNPTPPPHRHTVVKLNKMMWEQVILEKNKLILNPCTSGGLHLLTRASSDVAFKERALPSAILMLTDKWCRGSYFEDPPEYRMISSLPSCH